MMHGKFRHDHGYSIKRIKCRQPARNAGTTSGWRRDRLTDAIYGDWGRTHKIIIVQNKNNDARQDV